ncbi:c-type cytochrome biogenesis protein CcsB [Ruania zhangjianzhongii]|uniref:c-type cytochrome biogenesis protein CcsB n=1 Tax=Ruania zhangjianzhongii TaxID=2603206 RepID=UPI0011CCB419|nr:c-type cytochrome biogenesis protein CcsB [Ruania zhangjianzhongii]
MNTELGAVSTLLVYGAMACYVVAMVAFAVDVSALGVGAKPDRRRRAAGIGMSVIWLAVLVHFVAIVLRGVAAGRVPWANMYEFTLMFTFFLVALFVGIQRRKDIRYLGVGVALLAFLALFLATAVLFVEADGVQPALDSYWLVIHVSVATLATGLFGLSALTSVVQLVKGRREARADEPTPAIVPGGDGSADGDGGASGGGGSGRGNGAPVGERGPGGGSLAVAPARARSGPTVLDRVLDPLPAAADLERFAYRLNAVAFVAWTFTVVAGAVWAEHAWGRPWGWDPKETWSFVIWVIYAAYLHARVTTGWAAQRFAYFALAGFVALLANFYVVNIFFDGRHSYSGL